MFVEGAVQTGAATTGTFAVADGAGSKLTLYVVQLDGALTTRTAEVMGDDKDKQMPCRLYNVTDAVELCFDGGDKEEANRWEANSGFVHITLAGASKDIAIQFASPEGITVSCRRARVEFWRVA